jgi:adenosylhomocysteine nucleosidase
MLNKDKTLEQIKKEFQVDKKYILIVCALEVETQNQLNDWNVLYTGVGKVNATYHMTKGILDGITHGQRPRMVINYGTAGSRKIKKKTLVDCTRFIQRDMDVTGLGFMKGETPFEKDIPIVIESDCLFNPIGRNATCGTGDNFAEDKSQYYGEVVDMEAYALAKVCQWYDVPFVSFKYITDGADEQAHEDWEANLSDGIVQFKNQILSEID